MCQDSFPQRDGLQNIKLKQTDRPTNSDHCRANNQEQMQRRKSEMYPDYSGELKKISEFGASLKIIRKIIELHSGNARHTQELYDRYRILDTAVPIFTRLPRFEDGIDSVNNHINNGFFGEIIDFKTGYFAGKPIVYNYSDTEESENDVGGEEAVKEASRVLSDFTTRNNMYDIDMETTRISAICGYCGRLFYIDPEGNERVMVTLPYNTILLFKAEMTEPSYAIRYYHTAQGLYEEEILNVEFYDMRYVYYYKGSSVANIKETDKKLHLFDYCPLQGIPNNRELIGDAEKVLALIDDYDRVTSDNSNELESFAHAYMEFRDVTLDDDEYQKASKTGAIEYQTSKETARVGFIVKNINDVFNQNHLSRTRDNIYKFSATPNLSDESFGSASGVSLKFKLTGVETKCGIFQAKLQTAGVYMFRLLASSWHKKKIEVNPLQCYMSFKRNFPLDVVSEAAAVQNLIAAGLPKRVAYECLSWLDDIDYVMQLIEEEQNGIPPLEEDLNDDENGGGDDGSARG